MDALTTVFQFEIRYNHILNFSQIARKILSPYVRLAQSIKIENQNTIEERIVFLFDEDDYVIIAGWDRILIKGQGSLDKYRAKNSSIETPFFSMLNHISSLDEFGTIQNVLFAANYIKKLDLVDDKLLSKFMENTMKGDINKVLDKRTDISITLENKVAGEDQSVSFGPYFGKKELLRRTILPLNIDKLGDTDFKGLMAEYKCVKYKSDVSFNDFVNMAKVSDEVIDRIWKTI